MRRVGEIVDQIDLQGKNQELIDELVSLSTRHGILTPYTAFLADDTTNLNNLAGNRSRAVQGLELLRRTAGQSAFEQRRLKSLYQYSDRFDSFQLANQPALPAAEAGQAISAGGVATRPARPLGAPVAGEAQSSRAIQKVQNIGSKTFYLREGGWVDSCLTEEQKKQVVKLKRFSPEYFDLFRRHGSEVAKYLAIEGQVTVVLDGQAYAF